MNLFFWVSGIALAAIWLVPVIESAAYGHRVATITDPKWTPSPDHDLPSLSVVVPARNEAATIEAALRSLLALEYPGLTVVAVDDRSTDATGEILDRVAKEPAAAGKLRVIHVRELPPDWLGKTHAMWLGAQQTQSEWILFTDADCVFHREALRRAIHYAEFTRTDHLVLMPTLVAHSWGEKMMIAFLQVAGAFAVRPWKVPDPEARDFIGAGAFNLVRRSTYENIGTFEALRMQIVDDLKLGETIKRARFRQDVVLGPGLLTLRWFEGVLGLVRNVEKNMFALLRFRVTLVLAACVGLLFVNVWSFLGLLVAPGWSRAPFALAIALIAIRYRQNERVSGVPAIAFLTNPIAAVLTALAALRSAFAVLRDGAVTWRGTKYPVDELRKASRC